MDANEERGAINVASMSPSSCTAAQILSLKVQQNKDVKKCSVMSYPLGTLTVNAVEDYSPRTCPAHNFDKRWLARPSRL